MKKLRLSIPVILAFIAVHIASAELWAQDRQQDQLLVNNKSTANMRQGDADQISLTDLLSRVEEKFSVTFLYDHQTVVNKFISRSKTDLSEKPGSGLSRILQELGLVYEEIHEGIFLVMPGKAPLDRVSLQQTVSGTVTDAQSGETLPGVNVMVKGTTTGTSSGTDGSFELAVESLQDTLVFSFVGYQTQELSIDGRTEIDVALQPQAIAGEELVVVGYGTQRERNVTASISSVSSEQLNSKPITNSTQALQGTKGVYVNQMGAQPGRSQARTRIRGQGTLNNNNPLVLVDG